MVPYPGPPVPFFSAPEPPKAEAPAPAPFKPTLPSPPQAASPVPTPSLPAPSLPAEAPSELRCCLTGPFRLAIQHRHTIATQCQQFAVL